jgi:formate dehydrogenase subunit delta
MSSDKLVTMANQIGTFFISQGRDQAPPAIAEHLRKFWHPRMRQSLLRYVSEGGQGLRPEVRLAVQKLTEEELSLGGLDR